MPSIQDQTADSNGFKQVRALMLMHLSNEQNATAEALKEKMPQNSHGPMAVVFDKAGQNFDTVLRRFR